MLKSQDARHQSALQYDASGKGILNALLTPMGCEQLLPNHKLQASACAKPFRTNGIS